MTTTIRLARLQPWYHQPMPRCDAIVLFTKERCLFSARYTDTQGRNIHLCKTHADMADFPVKLIRATRVTLR